ncbi:multifunctional nuclease/2',3'-cyclic-nucleotide 2'-phosphodiesterase/5'-nucleotidase/3'-nucleotidase [Nakamurella silvestris]|nr:multifunctional nuclease/2',3'-cyclic-nucleotide 2'-phosphodiesterase/5'-nucleotidase/3'-nucleotidase [Nakamurella silvestris]
MAVLSVAPPTHNQRGDGVTSWRKRLLGSVSAVALTSGMLVVLPTVASAADINSQVIINEIYGAGGNSGAVLANDFVELWNKGTTDVSLSGKSLQYAAAAGTNWSGNVALTGTIKAGSYFLVQLASGGAVGAALPAPDQSATAPNLSGTTGNVALVQGTTALACSAGACATNANVLDIVGFGTGAAFAGSVAPAPSATLSISRNATHDNTYNNGADFTAGAPTPTNSAGNGPVDPGGPGGTACTGTVGADTKTIAEVQGTGAASPLVGTTVTISGVVTGAYPTGGFNGFFLQTAGSGGDTSLTGRTASDGVFVYTGTTTPVVVTNGQYVQVTGSVVEFNTLTEVNLTSLANCVVRTETVPAPIPVAVPFPASDSDREKIESMLIQPAGDFTVSEVYAIGTFGEVTLASGTTPLIQPTDKALPTDTAGIAAIVADNAARKVVLSDGASGTASTGPVPFSDPANPARVGAKPIFNKPVILDYRNSAWNFQPTTRVTSTTALTDRTTFTNTRTAAPANVGGNLKIASFNVLNYFNVVGTDLGCTSSFNSTSNCDARGGQTTADRNRQLGKIVVAINSLGADVVSLEEIENSVKFASFYGANPNRDTALATLVTALNAAAGAGTWAFAPSPAASDLPAVSAQDFIRTAFIYKPAKVSLSGVSKVLVGSTAFVNARQPLAQVFQDVSTGYKFRVVVNHFKSKGSAGPLPGDADSGDGQGASNASRVAQAGALLTFVNDLKTADGVEDTLLAGDFNSYSKEDPSQAILAGGFHDIAAEKNINKSSYVFDGLYGSLDHIYSSGSINSRITGADIWQINANEPVAAEYSRFTPYGAQLFEPNSPYRASDHNPEIIGLNTTVAPAKVDINLLAINDFHGRIDTNTVKWAGTIEKLRQTAGASSTLLVGAGDLVSASLFPSAVQDDQPTIDVMNEVGLNVSAVGNHEFDKGWSDLKDRIIGPANNRNAKWDYLGANVYNKGTTTPALPEYSIFTIDGVKIAVTGAVTQETPTLVSPAGVANLDFGDPVDAVNRVANQLSDGNQANGEADIVIATFHEGAPDGTQTLADQVAKSAVFAKIVNGLNSNVDVIFNGHTHQKYAYNGAVPGVTGKTRPILQTGSYGDNIGQVVLTVDTASKTVDSYTMKNVARSTDADTAILTAYPQLQPVKTTVDNALAYAATIGNQKKGEVTKDITTAYSGGSFVGGVWTGGTRDDRGSESTLGNKVADALLDTLDDPTLGGAQIGVVNPGGLRAELFDTQAKFGASAVASLADKDISYSQANAVLPFVNNLWTTTLTGAQFKTMLEQQWQTNPDGSVPTRSYLQLGLSENVTYTFDDTRTAGDRITSITINGAPYSPTASYRIGTFSFLTAGGDNFRIFTSGTDARDSGLIDRDAWITYLQTHLPTSPSYAKHGVKVTGFNPNPSWTEGTAHTFTVAGLNLTSLGSPANTTVNAKIGTTSLGDFAVTAGSASVTITVPAGVTGSQLLVLTASPSNTKVTIPFTAVAGPKASTTEITAPTGKVKVSPVVDAVTVKVTTTSADASGAVTVKNAAGTTLGTGTVNAAGTGTVTLTTPLVAGDYVLTAVYAGNSGTDGSTSATSALRVTFTDAFVNPFLDEIQWLTTNKITTGYAPDFTQFKPILGVERQAMAAWLYRYTHQGADAPACTTKPAADVQINNQFCGAIKWMYDTGLTTGYNENGGNNFRPLELVQREQAVTFLYRLSGGTPTTCSGATGPFPDVPKTNPFCSAITWAVANGITTGSNGKFLPQKAAERQALAAFLYRFDKI